MQIRCSTRSCPPGRGIQIKEAEAALKKIGFTLRRHKKLRSKTVTANDDLLCIGSFNWLSVERVG